MSGARSGIGYGEAQVYNTNGSMNAFNKVLQSQELQRQREQKELAEQIKNINTEGLREPDRDEYYKLYDNWRNKANEAYHERDNRLKFQKQSEAEKERGRMLRFIQESKEQGKQDYDISLKMMDDRFRSQFTDGATQQLQANFKKSINDPTYLRDRSALARQVNTDAIMKKVKDLNGILLKRTGWETIEKPHVRGNEQGTLYYSQKNVNPSEQEAALVNLYKIDRDFKKFTDDKAAEIGVEPETYLKQFAEEQRKAGLLRESTEEKFRPRNNQVEMAYLNDRLTRKREADRKSGESPTEATQRQSLVDALKQGDYLAERRLQSITEANPDYRGAELKIEKKGNIVTYTIPAKISIDKDGQAVIKEMPFPVEVNLRSPNAGDMINEVVSRVTGKVISNEEYRAVKGNKNKADAPIIQNNYGKQPAKSQEKAAEQKSGEYTNQTKVKDASGKVITIGVKNGKWYNIQTGKEIK